MLSLEQVAELADAVARPEQPFAVMAATTAQREEVAIGHDLFTAMRFHAQVMEVERVYFVQPRSLPDRRPEARHRVGTRCAAREAPIHW